jgi:hypothetical protein
MILNEATGMISRNENGVNQLKSNTIAEKKHHSGIKGIMTQLNYAATKQY